MPSEVLIASIAFLTLAISFALATKGYWIALGKRCIQRSFWCESFLGLFFFGFFLFCFLAFRSFSLFLFFFLFIRFGACGTGNLVCCAMGSQSNSRCAVCFCLGIQDHVLLCRRVVVHQRLQTLDQAINALPPPAPPTPPPAVCFLASPLSLCIPAFFCTFDFQFSCPSAQLLRGLVLSHLMAGFSVMVIL